MGGVRAGVVALVWASVAQAQEPLDLREAVTLALSTQPQLVQADALVSRATAVERETSAMLYPSLTVDATLTRFQEPMVVAPLHGFDPLRPPLFDRTLAQGNIALGYTVWDGGARGARVARASAQADAARAAAESAAAAVVGETVRRYAAVLTARELLASHAARVEALDEERGRAARLLEQGRAARVVVLRADAALSSARAEHASAAAQLELAEHDLARQLGVAVAQLRGRPLQRFVVRSTAPERDESVRRALASNADVRRLRAQVSGTEAGESEASAQWWPRVQLGSRYVRYASGQGDAGGEWQGGVQLSYALFTSGARPAAQDRAHAETRAAAAELAQAELRVAEQIDRAHAALTSARARGAALAAAVDQSTEVVRIERLALDAGAGAQTDYLAAEAELLRVRAALTDARYAEVLARVELARVMGTLTVDWIDQNVETGQ